MSRIIKKLTIVLMAVLLCCSSINWRVFAENDDYSIWADQSELHEYYVDAMEGIDLFVGVSDYTLSLEYKWYKLENNEWVLKKSADNADDGAEFAPKWSVNDPTTLQFKCVVSGYGHSEEVFYTVYIENNIEEEIFESEVYIEAGETYDLECPYYADDESGFAYQWYKYNYDSDEYDLITGAQSRRYTVSQSGNYKVVLTETKYANNPMEMVFTVTVEEEDPGFESYTVTYHLYTDEETSQEVTEEFTYSEETTWPLSYNEDNFEKYKELDHKAFKYWSLEPDGYEFDGMIQSDLDLYAVYDDAYIVTYKYNGENVGERKVASENCWDAFSYPNDLAGFEMPAGMGFKWYSLNEGGSEYYREFFQDITLYIVLGQLYTVTYYAYDEVVAVKELTGYDWNCYYDDNGFFDKYIKHDGEQFLYWSESEGGPRFNGELKKDTELHAVFGKEYTVTYMAHGEEVGRRSVAGDNWNYYLDQWNFPDYEPVEGETFRYWSDSEGGSYFDGYITEDKTLYAVFGVVYTVRYWCNGECIGERSVFENDNANFDISDFSYEQPEGMAFVYWSESENGPRFSGYITKDTNLYAVFEEAYTVTYHYEGKPIGVRYVAKSEPWNFRASLEDFYVSPAQGYGFSYWSESEGGSEFTGPIKKDTDLYAVVGKLCTVNYWVDNNIIFTREITEGREFSWYDISDYYAIPDDMIFSHWSRTPGGERFTGKVYEDMDVYAVIVKAVNVTYVIGNKTYTRKTTGKLNNWWIYPDSDVFPGYVREDGVAFRWWSLTPDGSSYDGDLTADTTVYAVFALTHTVTYWYGNQMLGKRSVIEEQWSWDISPEYFGEIEYPEGYVFGYWGDKDGNRFSGIVTSDMDLYLIIEEGYVVTYYYQGELIGTTTTPKSRPWDYGYSLAYFNITPPEGYGLAYWSDSPDGERFEGRLTGNIALYAVLGKLVTVEYYADGVVIATEQIPSGSYAYWIDFYDHDYTVPDDKDFAYWSTEENGEYFEGPITEETTKLYAVFYQKYTVQFYQGDVLLGEELYSRNTAYDITNTIRPEDFDEYTPVENCAFAYWQDADGNRFTEDMLTKDLKLYAYFEKCITVRYHLDGEVIYTKTDATPNNYNIDDYLWNNYSWGEYTYYYSLSENGEPFGGTIDGDVVDIYITRFKSTITITFDTQGGVMDVQSIEYRYTPYFNQYYVGEYIPTKEGYYFGGWTYDPECTRFIKDNDIILDDFTLYAYWIEDTKAVVKLNIYDETGEVTVEGEEGEYPVGSTVTIRLTCNGENGFIYSSYVSHNTDKVTDICIDTSLTREITFKTTAGLNEVIAWCYKGNNELTFVVDPEDRSKDVKVYTDRFGNVDPDQVPSPEKDGYFLLGWRNAHFSEGALFDLTSMIISNYVLVPVYEKTNVEANVRVEIYRIKLVEDPQWGMVEQEELVDQSGYTISGAGKHMSGTDCVITVKSAKAAGVTDVRIFDPNGNQTPFRYYIYKEGHNVQHFITSDGYSLNVPVMSYDQTVKIYIEDKGSVKVINRIPSILTVTNNAANGIATGQTVTIEFEIADGYALDEDRPFIYDETLMRTYSRYLSMDGEIINNYDSDYGNAEYDLNSDAVQVTDNSISWKMGYGELEFNPNIVFVGYNTPEENNLNDVLDVQANDDYNAPGIVFYNNSNESKEYNVTFSKAEAQSAAVSASMVAARGAAFITGSSVTPVTGDDGMGYVILYITKGKAGEAGTKQDPVYVKNLVSLNVKVEPGEFISYSICAADSVTDTNEVKYEVKDNKGVTVDEGYISINDDSKHLVYEEVTTIGAPTITTAKNYGRGVLVEWDEVPGATGYVIYRRAWDKKINDWTAFARWNNTTELSFLDTKVYEGSKYQYGIKAYYGNDPLTTTKLGPVGPMSTALIYAKKPDKTTSTTVANTAEGIKISWTPVKGAIGYIIYRRAWSSTTNGWTDFKRWNNTTATEWTDTQVYAGSRYQYGIKAYYGNDPKDMRYVGEVGPLKTNVRITTRKITSLTASGNKITVKWDASSVFTGYQIQYADNSSFSNLTTITISDPKTVSRTFTVTDTDKTYYVRVRSYHVFEGTTYYGGWSEVKTVTP